MVGLAPPPPRSLKHVFCRIWSEVLNCRFSALQRLIFYQTCRLHFAIKVCLRSCTAGLYVVTKGNSLSLFFVVFVLAPINVSSQGWPLTTTFLYLVKDIRVLRVSKALFKCFFFFLRSFLINLISSPLMERGKVCILKGFSRPIVGFDACPTKIDFSVRCSPLKTTVSRKVTSLFHISAVDLIFGMGFVSFFNKKLGLFCYSPKQRKRHQWNVCIGISMLD